MTNADWLGIDLGYGAGWRNGWDYANNHPSGTQLPVSENRADLYATGFRDGAVSRWCDVHTVFGPPPEPLTEQELANAAAWGKDILGSSHTPVGSAAGQRIVQYLTDSSLERLGLSNVCRSYNSCYRRIFGILPGSGEFLKREKKRIANAEEEKSQRLAERGLRP